MTITLDGTDGITTPQINASNIVGQVCFFGMTTAPEGFLKANGAAVSRTTYSELFAAIGTTYGAGDGSTTFNLPDLRGEFVRGWDDGRGVDSGRSLGSAQEDAFQGHYHNLNPQLIENNVGSNGAGSGANRTVTNSTKQPVDDGSNGVPRTASETRPRNISLLACIKH